MTKAIFKVLTSVALFALLTVSSVVFAFDQEKNAWQLRFPTERETINQGIPVIKKYMELTVNDYLKKQNTDAERFALISKEYLSSQGLDPDLFKLNDYGFEEFRIVGAKRNYIMVKGFNRSNGWARIVTFRILVENGSFVIEPSNFSRKKDGKVGNFVTGYWTSSDLITE